MRKMENEVGAVFSYLFGLPNLVDISFKFPKTFVKKAEKSLIGGFAVVQDMAKKIVLAGERINNFF